ncbi:Cytochrome P450 [Glarea lozoyensis ATCC 20868]|uniref:Cytochrome P450 monooxygenase gloP n=1 Tax=Glarea lozoyensis (strain ATCC 20868 / MF5171) TaxID=1116229 RepID=GLOP_GLAL2|nr:Cytochrome P450 [Glarea lozoyensis ATCC 20868]S3DQN8.1 RecName: Full=Cytochrome P450 monooxygenase gloP; AltName: Full=Homotyrosine 4-hydroxylase; AltName: Full=Pneumocandin biosynthesis cluster protein P [Glarea lozoyensis ATCC 20868]EPE34336.1 Cytochrome P450 [Glarea lozoyensis ATCC 20868]
MLSEVIARVELLIGEQTLSGGILTFLFIVVIAHFVLTRFTVHSRFWNSQAWTGVREEWFPKMRAKVRTIGNIRQMLSDGYEGFSKQNKAFALPVIAEKPWLVLPHSCIPELLAKSDSEIDMKIIHEEQLMHEYTTGSLGRHVVDVPIQYDILLRQVNRKLPLLISAFNEELDKSFCHYWGTDTSYSEVNLSETCEKIVTQALNRIFAGKEICRDEGFLEHSRLYSEGVGRNAIMVRMLPPLLRPLLAPFITYSNRKHRDICLRVCLPVIRERVQHTAAKRADAEHKWEPPLDVLQWIIEESFARNDPKELDPRMITQRLLALNFVAIDTTHMSMAHTILDLYRSPNSDDFLVGLREECERVLQANGGQWTKSGLDDLVCVDSTIRESMRYSDLGYISLTRMVVDPKGTQFNANGTNSSSPLSVPPGIRICVPAHAIHRDAALYPSPYEFQAFRFSKAREKYRGTQTELSEPKVSIVTTTDKFLPFGHGRHACPGRFFAAQQMKLMLAYLVQNYDVEKLSTKIQNKIMVGTTKPDASLKIKVKRRKV